MTVFVKRGSNYYPTSKEELNFEDVLPPGNYVLKTTPRGWYFEQVEPFEFEGKIYGSAKKYTERMYNTYLERTNSTGVMLAGEKGCGKSLQAKMLANKFISEGHPCIIVNEPYNGDHFNKLMQDIKQPCVVLFDEFEKVYSDSDNQQAILTLLDGVFPTKKMFVLTCNDKFRVDVNMRNRPGRIYYMIDYVGLEVEFIREYCQDNLNEKKYIDTICSIATTFNSFNFDMLKAIVEEMNRYNESPLEVVKLLNTRPTIDELAAYDIEVVANGVEVYYHTPDMIRGTPFSNGNPTFKVNVTEDDYDKDNDIYITVEPQDLVKMDAVEGTYVFACKDESLGLSATITYRRRKNAPYTPFGGLGGDL